MLDYDKILELIDRLENSELAEINIESKDFGLSLKKAQPEKEFIMGSTTPVMQAPQVQAAAPIETATLPTAETPASTTPSGNLKEIKSPMVGTYYAAPSPDADDFVKVGQKFNADDTLCIIEAMKVMNEFPAETEGEIVEILAKNGETVEFGQVLFRVK